MTEITARQQTLLKMLQDCHDALPGQTIADQLGVTRQVVVREIAILRAQGKRIMSTPKGYIVEAKTDRKQSLLAVSHRFEQTVDELNALVDYGIKVIDVRVEHAVYGELVANLFLSSRRDVEHFIRKIADEKAPLLSSLTGGAHYHLVEFDDDEQLRDAIQKLRTIGIEVFE